jgi:hypothetical protein
MRRIAQGLYTLLLVATLFVLLLSGCTDEEPLPPVSLPQSLPRPMKGYELYSWKSGSAWRFTLITGTNRLKTVAEIASSESILEGDWVKTTVEGVADLESVLERLPSGTEVSWCGACQPGVDSSTSKVALRIPPGRVVKEIQSHCAELGIRVEISR